MQTADPVHKSDTCAAASNVMFLITAPIDCALQISDTCSFIESSLLNATASVFTIKISTGACCMIRSICSTPLIYGRLSGIKGFFLPTNSLFHCLAASAFALFVATTNFHSWQFFEDSASISAWRICAIASLTTTLLLYFLLLLLFLLTQSFFFSFTVERQIKYT